jgi:hypothetical protein
MLSVAVAPFLTIRKTHIVPSSLDIYFHQVMFFGWAVALISIPLLWFMQFKPYFEMKDGHHYVGKFRIVNKKQVLGYCFLSLFPGKRNWIKVSQKIYHSSKIGETIELRRAFFGGVNGIRVIRNIRQRLKGNYYNRYRKELIEQRS